MTDTNRKSSDFICGDIISWQREGNEQRTIAAYDKDGMFQIAMHYRSEKRTGDNTFNLWYYDPVPTDEVVRKADKDEILEFIWALVENGQEFRMNAKRQIFLPEYDEQCGYTDEITRWQNYLSALCNYYQYKHTLNGASFLRSQYHVGGVTKEQFFGLGLNTMMGNEVTIPTVCKVINSVKKARQEQNSK